MYLLILAVVLYGWISLTINQPLVDAYFIHPTPITTKPSEESSACPSPLNKTTFLEREICVHPCLAEKLTVANRLLQQQGLAQASTLKVQRLTGFRPGQTSLHGQGMALDINAATNPYVIHERNETKLDEELA